MRLSFLLIPQIDALIPNKQKAKDTNPLAPLGRQKGGRVGFTASFAIESAIQIWVLIASVEEVAPSRTMVRQGSPGSALSTSASMAWRGEPLTCAISTRVEKSIKPSCKWPPYASLCLILSCSWAGILLLYHKLNRVSFTQLCRKEVFVVSQCKVLRQYCLGSRYVPPRKKLVFKMFDFYDYDSSGTLELEEFVLVSISSLPGRYSLSIYVLLLLIDPCFKLARHLCKDIFSEFMEKVYITFFAVPLFSYLLTPYIHTMRHRIASNDISYIPNESAIISFVTSLLIFLVPWLLHGVQLFFSGRLPTTNA